MFLIMTEKSSGAGTATAFGCEGARAGADTKTVGWSRGATGSRIGGGMLRSRSSFGEPLVIEEVANPRCYRGIGGGDVGDEVGAGVGSSEEAGGLVVGSSSLLGGLEGPKPQPDLLRGILDLCYPSTRGPLPHANKFGAAAAALGPPPFELGGLGDRDLVLLVPWLLLLELEFHE